MSLFLRFMKFKTTNKSISNEGINKISFKYVVNDSEEANYLSKKRKFTYSDEQIFASSSSIIVSSSSEDNSSTS